MTDVSPFHQVWNAYNALVIDDPYLTDAEESAIAMRIVTFIEQIRAERRAKERPVIKELGPS